MNDRELLELAAKAAGYKILGWWGDGAASTDHPPSWNPLTDDGDALRLAVELNLTLRCYMGNTCAQTTVPGGPSVYIDEWNHTDPLAATRRAIVRAAAEIGKEVCWTYPPLSSEPPPPQCLCLLHSFCTDDDPSRP